MTLDRTEIEKILPHRDPFLFVDAVENFDGGKIEAVWELKPSLPFFAGHFPNNPIMPGVLAAEALAQASGLALALSKRENGAEWRGGSIFYLASNNIKFVNVAHAGDRLILKSKIVREFGGLFSFSVEACTAKHVIASGSLVLASAQNVEK